MTKSNWLTIGILIAGTLQCAEPTRLNTAALWKEPADIGSRNLLYGSGGKKDMPAPGSFQFLKEDMHGSNPKFTVKDSAAVKWKVKLGPEARPETVATRFVWAAGYFTDEDYFLETAGLTEVPASGLRRLKGLITSDAMVRNARFERERKGDKEEQSWKWKHNDFTGTRELNGLRVLMAMLNNWDLKDDNNAIYKIQDEPVYVVSDLGATFGTTSLTGGHEHSRGNLKAYGHSRFITHSSPERVDFATPGTPAFFYIFNPYEFFMRLKIEPVGRKIPRSDAKWIGSLLARLSPVQIRDAFRSAGYKEEEVEAFARIVERRIAALNAL